MDILTQITADTEAVASIARTLGTSTEDTLKQLTDMRKVLEGHSAAELVRRQLERLVRNGAELTTIKAAIERAVTENQNSDIGNRIVHYVDELIAVQNFYGTTAIKAGLNLGPDFQELDDRMGGLRTGGKIYEFGGVPSSGKTSVLRNLSINLAEYNDDVFVCYLSLDDSNFEMLQHLVSQVSKLPSDLVANAYRATTGQKSIIDAAWKKILVDYKDKFMVIDGNMCQTLTDIVALMRHLTKVHKDKKLIILIDNFHDIKHPIEEIREKNVHCANTLKDAAVECNCTVMMSVQLTKIAAGSKPTRTNIAETVQLDYKGNMIMLVHNEVDANPLRPEYGIRRINAAGDEELAPVIEVMAQKNKVLHQCKGSFFFRFDESSSRLIQVPRHDLGAYKIGASAAPGPTSTGPSSSPSKRRTESWNKK